MPAITDTIKVESKLSMSSLLSAGENRSFFIMPEFYNGVNDWLISLSSTNSFDFAVK